jgi:hypothetical protein
MGMFDEVRCLYPLPWPEAADFGREWQSKDTPAQYLDLYEIREDGTLWHERHEDKTWVHVKYTGEIEIHHMAGSPPGRYLWYSVRFWFRDGVVKDCVPAKTIRGEA